MKQSLSSALIGMFLLIPFGLNAQEEMPQLDQGSEESTESASDSLPSCFDYYRFGSVPVVIGSETVRVAQGGTLNLKGTIVNENTYPLDDVTVYAKVFYKKNFDKDSFGPDVVDWFVLADGLNLKAGETRAIASAWAVPSDIEPGFYQVATYVAQHDRFNYAGLTFSNDVVGNLFNFSVAGEDLGSVRFDKTKTVLNNQGFHAAIFPPRTQSGEEGVPLTAVISNTTGTPFAGTVHWSLYSWDGINGENLLAESEAAVSVGANASTTVSYLVADDTHTVYFIKGELRSEKDNSAKSIITARYISTGDDLDDRPRLAAIGVKTFPGEQGTELFACVHSTGTRASEDDTRVVITSRPLDPLSWILSFGSLGKTSYEGPIPGAIVAITAPMTRASNNFSITASLYQGGALIDEVTTTYSCKEFSDSCPPLSGWPGRILLALIVILVLGGLGYLIAKRLRHGAPVAPNPYQ